ncbi:MAG: Gfo/Idh/MocA family oxidoreductase [Candidatus Azobacteroides sp.]|nr:Gfo/Idh/MocA family oxidoreductase [Candidatus Azobacteroides sp.]
MENIVKLLKKIRKQNMLLRSYSGSYAFVGIGSHSVNNLYPVLHYLDVPLKYIVVKSQKTAKLINENRTNIEGTTDYDRVLADPEIKGVLICVQPDSHYELVKKALQHEKNVFVEKPPCCNENELRDLIETERIAKKNCLVGLQKRYSTCTSLLKKAIAESDLISYNYRFVVGNYPEGDPYWDLFIHPVDLATFIFGEMQLVSVVKTGRAGAISLFIQARQGQAIASIELSTQYSWNNPCEHLIVNTSKGVYTLRNHRLLDFRPAPGVLFSIPKEKIFPSSSQTVHLFDGNSFLPVVENNELMMQGFYRELKCFVDICENKRTINQSTLASLIPTFDLLADLKTQF